MRAGRRLLRARSIVRGPGQGVLLDVRLNFLGRSFHDASVFARRLRADCTKEPVSLSGVTRPVRRRGKFLMESETKGLNLG